MKQWRLIVVVMGLIILLLIANFSIQIKKKRSVKNDEQTTSSTLSADLNSTSRQKARLKVTRKSNSSSIGDAKIDPNSKCWRTEETITLGDCIHCSDYEKLMLARERNSEVSYSKYPIHNTISGCSETGDIQQRLCIVSNIKVYKSCLHSVQWQEKQFWMFEGLMLVGLIVSSFVVWYRQRQLDKIFYQKLQKQVESDTV